MDNEKAIVYFLINGLIEHIEVNRQTPSKIIKDQLLTRVKGEKEDKGSEDVCVVSPSGARLLQPDFYFLCGGSSPDNPFRVEMIIPDSREHCFEVPVNSTRKSDATVDEFESVEALQRLLKKNQTVAVELQTNIGDSLDRMETRFLALAERIQSLQKWHTNSETTETHIMSTSRESRVPCCPDPGLITPSADTLACVLTGFSRLRYSAEKDALLSDKLKSVAFNNWEYSDFELLYLVRKMYIDLDLMRAHKISQHKLDSWLFEVYCNYNSVAFHNFKHAFMVTQMMYCMIQSSNDLRQQLTSLDHLTLLTASVSHDLNHPGYNNSFQINSNSALARLYNDQSPLENHHLAVSLSILDKPGTDLLSHLPNDQQRTVRSGLIKCILATDMSKHNEILTGFKSLLSPGSFDLDVQAHRDLLMMVLIKTSDISNEARPLDVASKWIDLLFQEFFQQSEYEKQHSLPVAPFMDKDKVTKPASQCGFIRFVIYPLFDSLAQVVPELRNHIVVPVLLQLDYYSQLDSLTSGNSTNSTNTASKPRARRSVFSLRTGPACANRRSSHQCTPTPAVTSSSSSTLHHNSTPPIEVVRKLST